MAELDETFRSLPGDLEPPEDPDAELDAADEDFEPFNAGIPEVPPLGRTYAYDFVEGRLMPGDPAGGPLMIYGVDSLAQWIDKFLRTERGSSPAVHQDFGIEQIDYLLDGGVYDPAAGAELEDMVREGLREHPRINDIDDWLITYEPGDDAVFITFRVFYEADDELDAQELWIRDYRLPLGGPGA